VTYAAGVATVGTRGLLVVRRDSVQYCQRFVVLNELTRVALRRSNASLGGLVVLSSILLRAVEHLSTSLGRVTPLIFYYSTIDFLCLVTEVSDSAFKGATFTVIMATAKARALRCSLVVWKLLATL